MKCRDCKLTVNPETPVCPRCGAVYPAREIVVAQKEEA